MKNKATHTGTCQCCGASQRLPEGVLSKHGYNVKWGFFEGVCKGAGELPYEQSCALIEKFIKFAETRLAEVENQIAETLLPATEPKGWYHAYGKTLPYAMRYRWMKVDLSETQHTNREGDYHWTTVVFTDLDGKLAKAPLYTGMYSPDALTVATGMNSAYVKLELEPIRKRLQNYIKWQQERVISWKLVDLKPIENS